MTKDFPDNKKVFSHAYIIASPDEELRDKAAAELACTIICDGGGDKPCKKCPQCTRALAGIHPDISTISRLLDDKGKPKRDLAVDQIRAISADAWVRPQQAEKKIYIIREAGFMNASAQNAALKLLEEPPKYAVFILCVPSAELLLPTIRSRCVIIRAKGESAGGDGKLSAEYISLASKKDEAALCGFFNRCEKLETDQLIAMLKDIKLRLSEIICSREKPAELSHADAVRLLALCDRATVYLQVNVSPKHILGLLCVLTT
ncbi:MAG: hypothetical protein RSD32_00580 [Oscillospiraceae bacterium]